MEEGTARPLELGDESYLVKERKPDLSFRLFRMLLKEGRKGLMVTRRHPSKFKDDPLFEDVLLVWLSHTPGENFHNPRSLGGLSQRITRFIREQEEAVVLLDGLEYLILNNNFVQTLLFVESVNEFAMQAKAIMLIPIAPEALEAKELALLERNLEVLEGEALRREMDRREVVNLIDGY